METQITTKVYGKLPDMLRASKDTRCNLWFSRPLSLNAWSFCAIGTISHQMGQHPLITMFGGAERKAIAEHCDIKVEDLKKQMQCTMCGSRRTLIGLLAHHNDVHDLSYKENADLLEKTPFYKDTTKQQKWIDTFARNKDGGENPITSNIIKILVKN